MTKSRLLVILKKFYKFSKNLRSSPPSRRKSCGGAAERWQGRRGAGRGAGRGGRAGRWADRAGRVAGRRSEGEASPVRRRTVPGPGELRPRSVRVVSPVREMCRDLRRQNVPKADYRPRSQRKVRTGDRKAADRGQKSRGPATERLRTGDGKAADLGRKS